MGLVLVTGAAGHVGGNLVRALLAQGRKVRALVHNDTRALEGLDVERVKGDVLDPATLRPAMEGVEVVYHLAAIITIEGDPDGRVRRTNVEGPHNVVAACLDAKVKRLIHFSSIHAFEQIPLLEQLDEGRPLEQSGRAPVYDQTKAAGQREVWDGVKKGLDAVIVHPTSVIGPFDFKPSRLGQVLLDLYFRRLPSLVGGGFDWVDVRDVVAAAMAAETRGRTGTNYLLGGKWRTVKELAHVAASVTGVRPPRFTSPLWLAKVGVPFALGWAKLTRTRPLYTFESLHALQYSNRRISSERAQTDLGYSARPLEETIADSYAWFREAGMLEGAKRKAAR
ncbi:MAG: NAD-dependent epimerase/dehydratase family protein [Deltaproteobacteria bacterium]|nr:NAD-dependent epimerase/dehydratase family protein [Deltaproteobacteria bacterium]